MASTHTLFAGYRTNLDGQAQSVVMNGVKFSKFSHKWYSPGLVLESVLFNIFTDDLD